MRTLTMILTDGKTGETITAELSMQQIRDMQIKLGLDGLSAMFNRMNEEMDKKTDNPTETMTITEV